MQTISIERSSFVQTAVVSLTTFPALALLGLILAYWTWEWFAAPLQPQPPTMAQAGGRSVAPTAAALALFGSAQREQSGAAVTGVAIKLLGVVAATGGLPAYALVQLDGKQRLAVRAGESVVPGVKLVEVFADRVVLDRRGFSETLALPERNTLALPASPATSK
ncbi:MAG: hypothetical protein M0P39_12620 [Rhodocyclaceae bacterium]|jgi:general secretion pathway protein C|nr:hypothetical protein [Rhodocyclaceae bacterium]